MQFSFQNFNLLQNALELATTTNMQTVLSKVALNTSVKGKGKVHPCTGTEALYRPYGP
jgi:hypothetical protein